MKCKTSKVFLLALVCFLGACTSASLTVKTTDLTANTTKEIKAKYFDLHPGGNAVETIASWEGIGSLAVERGTEDSDVLVEAAVEAAKAVIGVP